MKKIIFAVFLLLCIIVVVVNFANNRKLPSQLPIPTQPAQAKNFVTRQDARLMFNNKPYRSIGVNRYNLLTYDDPSGEHGKTGCANTFTQEDIASQFATYNKMGITTVRFWLFQSFTKSGSDMTRFDYVLELARKYNIKLIPVLENHWEDCTQGGDKNSNWYETGYTSPYGNYRLSLLQYVDTIIPQYANDSTILAWEIMNEPESSNEAAVYLFVENISQRVRWHDPNHLITVGLTGKHGSDALMQKISQIQTIDSIDYHDYEEHDIATPQQLQKRLNDAMQVNKPVIIGESGIYDSVSNRSELFRKKIASYFAHGGSVYLIWSYGTEGTTNDGYNFNENDPVAEVVLRTAQSLKEER